MVRKSTDSLADLYLADETAWLDAMAELTREGRLADLDLPHLVEHLEDMARRDRKKVESRLAILAAHVLKWMHQPNKRTQSWRGTIIVQRYKLTKSLEGGVLRNHAGSVLAQCYAEAVAMAADETGLSNETFPAECPWTLDQLLSEDVLRD